MVDLKGMFTKELRVRGQMKNEVLEIVNVVQDRVTEIGSLIRDKDYQALTNAVADLMEYNSYVMSIDAYVKLSESADERSVLQALDNAMRMIRYARDDVKAISQLAMNEANNAT